MAVEEQGFREPDWTAPLDTDALIRAVPADGTVRGMFLQEVVDAARARGVEWNTPNYLAFAKYPLVDYVKLLPEGARRLFPDRPVRLALRMLGHQVYPNFSKTMIGSAIFSVAGKDFARVVKLAARAYGVSISPGVVSVRFVGSQHIRVELRDIWAYPDCFQVGVWEGAMQVCRVSGTVGIQRSSWCDVDYDLAWRS